MCQSDVNATVAIWHMPYLACTFVVHAKGEGTPWQVPDDVTGHRKTLGLLYQQDAMHAWSEQSS